MRPILLAFVFVLGFMNPVCSQELSTGQLVYVPVYSNIYSGPRSKELELTATLSIRNIDTELEITVSRIDYHDSSGRLLRHFITEPTKLGPLASTHFIIQEQDTAGGAGAKFLVGWSANRRVNAPIIEAVMVTTRSGQGVSFISRGQPIIPHEQDSK